MFFLHAAGSAGSDAGYALCISNGAYTLKLPYGFKVMPVYNYWIFVEGKYEKANGAKQLAIAIPGKKEKINGLVKKNNTSFSRRQDIISLVQQL